MCVNENTVLSFPQDSLSGYKRVSKKNIRWSSGYVQERSCATPTLGICLGHRPVEEGVTVGLSVVFFHELTFIS